MVYLIQKSNTLNGKSNENIPSMKFDTSSDCSYQLNFLSDFIILYTWTQDG